MTFTFIRRLAAALGAIVVAVFFLHTGLARAEPGQSGGDPLDAAIQFYIDKHPGWQELKRVQEAARAKYEEMRARDPSLPPLEDAAQSAADYLDYEYDASFNEAVQGLRQSHAFQLLVREADKNRAVADHIGDVGDVHQMDRAQREQFTSMLLQGNLAGWQAIVELLGQRLDFYARVTDRVISTYPFDPEFKAQALAATERARLLRDYHVVTTRRVVNKSSDEIDTQKGTITTVIEKVGGYRGNNPTTDFVICNERGTACVTYRRDGQVDVEYLDKDAVAAGADGDPLYGADVDQAYVEQFIRTYFNDEEARIALLAIKLERQRQQKARGGPQANTQAIDAILAEMQALMSTPGFSFDDPRWKFLQDLLARTGLPELQFPPDTFADFLNGTKTLTVAMLEPIYADADMTRGERIERMTENLWAAAESTVIWTPDVWAAGPSKVTTTPKVWSEGQSNVATTPDVWSEGQSNVAVTPNVWAEGNSNVTITPDFWSRTPDYWGPNLDSATMAGDILKANTSAIGSGSTRRRTRWGQGGGIDYPYNERPIGIFLVDSENIQETAWVVIQGDTVHFFEGSTFGPITPPAGAEGPISALNNSGAVQTTMVKEWKLGKNQRIFTLDGFAKFVTTEFPRYIGSQFNDTSLITLTTPGGQSITFTGAELFGASVNASNFTPVSNLPAPLSGWNSGGAVNNGGGEAAWQRIQRILRVAPGGRVRITVTVQNVGDTAYPSATLLTNLRGGGSR